jgi:hypothetical protein
MARTRKMAPAKAQNGKPDVLVFVSYSHRDDKAREQFDIHTAALKREGVRFWFDGDMIAGEELDPNIRRQLKAADIFVALASPEYLHSNYCFEKEYSFALRKAARGKVHVVAALIKQCQWRHTRMKNYKMLPKDAKAVSQWARHADAYESIIEGLRDVVKAVRLAKVGYASPDVIRPSNKPKAAKSGRAPSKVRVAAKPKKFGGAAKGGAASKSVTPKKSGANPKARRAKRSRQVP